MQPNFLDLREEKEWMITVVVETYVLGEKISYDVYRAADMLLNNLTW